jgi:hypothetical protein
METIPKQWLCYSPEGTLNTKKVFAETQVYQIKGKVVGLWTNSNKSLDMVGAGNLVG